MRGCVGGAIKDTWSSHFPHTASAGSIECNRKGWLQQTAAHARNRIRERRYLPVSRCAGHRVSRSNVCRIKNTLLRFQRQKALSLGFGSTAAKLVVVKKSRHFQFEEVRQRFRLTSTEKRVAIFVAAVFVLGLITKCYRDAHPSTTPVQTHAVSSREWAPSRIKTKQRSAPNTGQPTRRLRKSADELDLSDSAMQQEHQQK